MSKPLAANRLLLGVDTWAQEVTAASGNFPAGSFWMRNGNYPTVPTELYLNTSGGANGWIKENLINLGVYNVKNYGAAGDGVTDDMAAINAAIAAARAAGGGTVYFPSTPHSYRITKPVSGLGSIVFDNDHDIVLLGDGPSSTIAMIGSAAAGDWYAVRIRDGSTRIGIYNLAWDGTGITNPDPADQNHFIDINGVAGDVHGGPTNIDIVGNFFGQIVGDCVRNLGETTEIVDNIRILYNAGDLGASNRSFVEAQRCSRRVQLKFNWMTCTRADNVIDFEPTGGTGAGLSGPEEWSIVGNHVVHADSGSYAVTLSGAGTADPATRNLFAFNTVQGGPINGVNMVSCTLRGNMVSCAGASTDGVLYFTSKFENISIEANVLVSLDATNTRPALNIVATTGSGLDLNIADNVASVVSTNAVSFQVFNIESTVGCVAMGNILNGNNSQAAKGNGIYYRPASVNSNRLAAVGNLVLAPNQALQSGVQFHAGGANMGNCLALANWTNNATVGVGFDRGAAETFSNWRQISCNVITNPTTATITPPPTNMGVSIAGMAGPGAQFVQNAVVPGGAVAAPPGSVTLDSTGGAATCLWYKESGVGLSGGTAGWIQDGGSDITFGTLDSTNATAARFLAPGLGQAAAGTVEVKIPLPRPGSLRNMRVTCTPGTGGGNNTYVLRKNGSNTTVTVTIANTAASGTGAGVNVAAAGDLLSVQVTKTVIPTTDQTNVIFTFELTG